MPKLDMTNLSEEPLNATADYDDVRRALEYMTQRWRKQPTIAEVAAHVGLSESHLHHTFRRFAGITPKAFLQALTLDHAKRLLRRDANLLDASLELGLSGPSRLHDLFITHEALSPGEWKTGGAGLRLAYGFHPSPFGEALIVTSPRVLAGLGWVDDKVAAGTAADTGKPAGGRDGALADMQRRWPGAIMVEDAATAASFARRIFEPAQWTNDQPLKVVMLGSDFEIRVWSALLKIPLGGATTYGAIAERIGKKGAARAVGAAVGRNPISFVVPCHRVLGSTGALTCYHWGLSRKQAILGWEAGKAGSVD